MNSYFILITANTYDEFGNRLNSMDAFKKRLNINSWHLNKSTANKDIINENDKVAFYVSDKRNIVGKATVSKKIRENNKYSDICYRLSFSNITLFKTPIIFFDRLKSSSIMPKNPSKWGVALMGGLRKISKDDFHLFTKELN